MKILKQNKNIFLILSKIFQDEKLIRFNNSLSISNWTYPAAISLLTGFPFEKHQKYFPWEKNYLELINKIYKGPNSDGLQNFKEKILNYVLGQEVTGECCSIMVCILSLLTVCQIQKWQIFIL